MASRLQQLRQTLRGFFARETEAVRELKKEQLPANFSYDSSYAVTAGGVYDLYRNSVRLDADMWARFRDYEDMDEYPDLIAALDTYADEATQDDPMRNSKVWFECSNDNVAFDLNFLLTRQLEFDDYVWQLARYVCKYGQDYERLFVQPGRGVIATEPLPPALTRRVYDNHGMHMGYMISPTGTYTIAPQKFYELLKYRESHKEMNFRGYINHFNALAFEPWEIAHFRLVSNDRLDQYGHSILESSRYLYRRLTMLEDAVVVHKLTRAPSRYVFYVDVGHYSGIQALEQVRRVKDEFKKQKFVNPRTGKLDMSYSPLAVDEDIFIPMSSDRGQGVQVQTLQGPDYQSVEDVRYFQRKMGRTTGIPNFGQDDDRMSRPMASLDTRFAAKTLRVQSSVRAGVKFMSDVHLLATNRDPRKFDHRAQMTAPSAILELTRLEVMSARADLIARYENYVSLRWLMTTVMGLSEEEAVALMVQRQKEIDYIQAAETERGLEAEKRMTIMSKELLGEDVARERAIFAENRVKHINHLKADRGAFGVTPFEFTQGREDIDAARLMRDIETNHKDLHGKIMEVRGLVKQVRDATAFRGH